MLYLKITHGYVMQTFDDNGNFVSQMFIAGDDVSYENQNGTPLDVQDMPLAGKEYNRFDMVQNPKI